MFAYGWAAICDAGNGFWSEPLGAHLGNGQISDVKLSLF
jgi:hypothetical protein